LKKNLLIILLISLSVYLSGCIVQEKSPVLVENDKIEDVVSDNIEEEKKEESSTIKQDINLQEIQPNELGEIMVLMYHHIREPEAEWSRTPDNFRRDLQNLYEKGYRPISLEDYASGNITTEAGFTPFVLTFDDGNQNNFNMIQNEEGQWEIDPDCAVGILEDFHKNHLDFPLRATFFINGGVPFGQRELVDYKLNYIIEKGMDIGNHTFTHANLTNLTGEKIQEEMGKLSQFVKKHLPVYEINTLALPFGSKPKNIEDRIYLEEGKYEGEKYYHLVVLEVGWDPYLSPFHKDFDSKRIRRVRASETKVDGIGLYDWIDAFDKGKRTRYISDGDAEIITVQEVFKERVAADINGEKIRVYTLD
jgi:peptidoglycan/xylan/chitin deacetylase (PgdA/CDA1 family)